ncbi:MAG: hypothetical protein V4696_07625 [Pseudomonadota bacterium]
MTPLHTLATIAAILLAIVAARLIWRELSRRIVPFSKGDSE